MLASQLRKITALTSGKGYVMLPVDPLPAADAPHWKKLEPAFAALLRVLNDPLTAAMRPPLVQALRALDQVLTACGLKWIADEWNTLRGDSPGSYARNLLQFAREPSGEAFDRFCDVLGGKEDTFRTDMCRRIRQFADQLQA